MKNSPYSRKNRGYQSAYEQGMQATLKAVRGALLSLGTRFRALLHSKKN